MIARAILAACAVLAAAAPGAAAQLPDPDGYCVPENTHYDPSDVDRPGAPAPELPPGATMRRISVAGFSTSAIEIGPQDSREAIVFMHGNPGNSLDFLGVLRAVPPGARAVAIDIIGFGKADKPWDFAYDLASSRPLVDRFFDELGIDRAHIVGHDVGSVVAVDWAARHPERLASAVLLAGGILIGYQDHHFARMWKTRGLGEMLMSGTDREGFVRAIQAHNPRPLPREFIDRNYDAFDRPTRCAVLKLYRAMPNLSELSREHARALRPYDLPALVIWGDRDPFLPAYLAASNREGFPHADIHVYPNSGHWPFVDEEARTVDLMRAFLARHVVDRAGAQIRLRVTPRRIRSRRVTRLAARVTVGDGNRALPGATVSLGGRRAVTGASGQARLTLRVRRPGLLRAVARKAGLVPAVAHVRSVRRSRTQR